MKEIQIDVEMEPSVLPAIRLNTMVSSRESSNRYLTGANMDYYGK